MTGNESDNLFVNRYLVSPIMSFESSSSCSSSNTGCTKITKATLFRTNSLQLNSFEKKNSSNNMLLLKSDNLFCYNTLYDDGCNSPAKHLPVKKLAKTSSLVSQADLRNFNRKHIKKYLNCNLEFLDLKIDLSESNQSKQIQVNKSFKKINSKNFSSILLSSPSSSSSSSLSSLSSLFNSQTHIQKLTKQSQTLHIFEPIKASPSSQELKSNTVLSSKVISINNNGIFKPWTTSSTCFLPNKYTSSIYKPELRPDTNKVSTNQSEFKVWGHFLFFFYKKINQNLSNLFNFSILIIVYNN